MLVQLMTRLFLLLSHDRNCDAARSNSLTILSPELGLEHHRNRSIGPDLVGQATEPKEAAKYWVSSLDTQIME
jgi:hypothetical protein